MKNHIVFGYCVWHALNPIFQNKNECFSKELLMWLVDIQYNSLSHILTQPYRQSTRYVKWQTQDILFKQNVQTISIIQCIWNSTIDYTYHFFCPLSPSLCFSISLIHLDSGFCLIPWTHARELSFSISWQTLKVFYCLYAECLWLRTVWHIKQTQKYSNSTNAQKSAIERHITPSSIYIGSDVLQSSALFFSLFSSV